MLVFEEEGKPENPKKNPRSKVRTNNKLNPQYVNGPKLNPGHIYLVGSEHFHHCTILVPAL